MVKGFRAATKNDISPLNIISHSTVIITETYKSIKAEDNYLNNPMTFLSP